MLPTIVAFYVQSFVCVPSLSSPLLLRNYPNTFAFIPIPPMSLSSLNRSNSKAFCHILPCVAPVCEGMHYHKTGVPWQTKSTRIIKISYHKKPWNAVFLGILPTCSCLVKSYILRGANLNGSHMHSCKELSLACFHLLCEDSILSTICWNPKAVLDETNILSCLYILLISRTTVEPHNSIFFLSHFRIKIESLQS